MDAATFAAIIADISGGTATHKAVAAADVSRGEFYRALDADPELADRYARAKSAGLECMADETLEIADDPEIDPNHKRIQVDTRKWLLSKLAPKRYGERVTNEHTGADGGPIQHGVTVRYVPAERGAVAGGVQLPESDKG